MKEIRTIKMVEHTEIKFVADDGKEFVGEHAERDCRDYERTKDVNRVKAEFERVDFKEIEMPFIKWFTDECCYYKAVLNSRRDFIAMMDYFKVIWNVYDNNIKEPTNYPYNMIVSYSWEYVSEYKEDIKEELQKALEQFN